ncbi:hypothetical protein H6503_05785 [Candidatus Woesearchaeota archaeon]|nr:hypothetical protein [Candidatus Woesearchaeota archaeon]
MVAKTEDLLSIAGEVYYNTKIERSWKNRLSNIKRKTRLKIGVISLAIAGIAATGIYHKEDMTHENVETIVKRTELITEGIGAKVRSAYASVEDLVVTDKYERKLNEIRHDLRKRSYSKATEEVKNLYRDIHAYDYGKKDKFAETLEAITYDISRRIPEKRENVLAKEGYYEKEWVKPEYEIRKNAAGKILSGIGLAVKVTTLGIMDPGEVGTNGLTKRVKVKDGYYRKTWVEPVYEIKITPEHYVTVRIKPLTGEETIVSIVKS